MSAAQRSGGGARVRSGLPTAHAKIGRRVRKAMAESRGLSGSAAVADAGRVRLPPVQPAPPPEPEPAEAVLAPMPRRAQVSAQPDDTLGLLPDTASAAPGAGILRIVGRLGVWLGSISAFVLATVWDAARGRDSLERRAVRLRQVIERAGGTLVKIGQQMSIRLDLLPLRYCQELALMLDSMPPFPVAEAIAVIERTTGRRLEEIFAAFDPVPIGSASIACVYQAVLRDTGARVAVKVRRPGIRAVFEADIATLDALTKAAEWLTIVPPGFVENLRREFRSTISSELDFRREARLQAMFVRRARKATRDFFSAPRVYMEWTNDELLVMEFVSGMFLSEVLAGVEHGDAAALERMRALNVDPRTVARHMLYAHNWGLLDHLAFHADPHPANIIVRANSELVFVDFGACGFLNRTRRQMFERIFEAFLREDAWGMAQQSIISIEPLPMMDLNVATKEMEAAYQEHILQIKSKQTRWYERTSANMWLASLAVINRHRVPAPVDILMYARATLLYDTLAARLWPQVDYYDEYRKFARDAGARARKVALRALGTRLRGGLTGADYEQIDRLVSTGGDLLFRLQRMFAAPYDFTVVPFVVEKWSYVLMTLLRFALRAAVVTAGALVIVMVLQAAAGGSPAPAAAWERVAASLPYQVAIGLLALVHLRAILFKLGDPTHTV